MGGGNVLSKFFCSFVKQTELTRVSSSSANNEILTIKVVQKNLILTNLNNNV